MSLLDNKHLIESFKGKTRSKVKRTDDAYREMYESTVEDLTEMIAVYKDLVLDNGIRSRRQRDKIDWTIKRYQRYCITEKIGSHYHQKGISLHSKDVTVEHVIPETIVREMLLDGVINIDQAINSPICRVSKQFDRALRKSGLVKMTPDPWFFFSRYVTAAKTASVALPEFETFNGQLITLETWSLIDHCQFFNISTV